MSEIFISGRLVTRGVLETDLTGATGTTVSTQLVPRLLRIGLTSAGILVLVLSIAGLFRFSMESKNFDRAFRGLLGSVVIIGGGLAIKQKYSVSVVFGDHVVDPMLTTSDREFAEGVSRTLDHLLASRSDAMYRVDPQHRTITREPQA